MFVRAGLIKLCKGRVVSVAESITQVLLVSQNLLILL